MDNSIPCWLADCGTCPYLPDKQFHAVVLEDDCVDPQLYRHLLDQGFRRNGKAYYRPHCPDCSECRQIRLNVQAFKPRKDQRRCAKRNEDLSWSLAFQHGSDEQAALYCTYQQQVHADAEASADRFMELLSTGNQELLLIEARDRNKKLVGLSITDRFADALSSVYCVYDPQLVRRSLGTFMALAEIAYCQEQQLEWLYLGFHVSECGKMAYKSRFQPYQLLIDGQWVDQDN